MVTGANLMTASVETAKFDAKLEDPQVAPSTTKKTSHSLFKERLEQMKRSQQVKQEKEPEIFDELHAIQQTKYEALELMPELRVSAITQ